MTLVLVLRPVQSIIPDISESFKRGAVFVSRAVFLRSLYQKDSHLDHAASAKCQKRPRLHPVAVAMNSFRAQKPAKRRTMYVYLACQPFGLRQTYMLRVVCSIANI